jgi:hypothetical protein
MLGKLLGKREEVAEIGMWRSVDGSDEPVFTRGGEETPWANVGKAENAKKLFDLSDEQISAIQEYGFIEIDSPTGNGTVYLEAGYGF